MESVGYMMLYFLKDRLPWQGLRANSKQQKYHQIMDQKTSMSLDELCMVVPDEFTKYMVKNGTLYKTSSRSPENKLRGRLHILAHPSPSTSFLPSAICDLPATISVWPIQLSSSSNPLLAAFTPIQLSLELPHKVSGNGL